MLFACLGLSTGLAALPEFGKAKTSYGRIKEIVTREPKIRFQVCFDYYFCLFNCES